MDEITFLGTGGGRFVILTQRRYSGGIWLEFGEEQIILDPGPGALIRALQFKKKPNKLKAIFVSHNHLDHYADCEVLIEAMTYGMKKKRGFLITNKETLPYISEYHQKVVEVLTSQPGDNFQVENLKVEALPTYHHAKGGIGFKFFTEKGIVSYTSDTAFSEKLIDFYQGSKILILNTIFPYHKEIGTHLNTKNALKVVGEVKPEIAVITHFGMQMLNSGPEREAKVIENETKVKTIAAKDGMVLSLDKGFRRWRKEDDDDEKQLKLSGF